MTDSREALLEAAWQVVVESFGFEPSSGHPGKTVDAKILEQLKAADITARAGMTTGAFYNRWPNRESFLEEFLDYAISVDRSPTFAAIASDYAKITDLPLIEQLERMAVINIDSVAANPSFAIQTHLWSLMRGRPDIRERIETMYKEFRDPMVSHLRNDVEWSRPRAATTRSPCPSFRISRSGSPKAWRCRSWREVRTLLATRPTFWRSWRCCRASPGRPATTARFVKCSPRRWTGLDKPGGWRLGIEAIRADGVDNR